MDAPATLVWIAPEPPDGEQSRALTSWASSRGVKLAPPADVPFAARPVDERIPEQVEKLLDRARDGLTAGDAEAVDHALAAAESTLRAHPELPQAAWLMAEILRARSARFRRMPPVDDDAADRAWSRAETLDGGRLSGVGERGAAGTVAAATVVLDGLPPGAELWLDGVAASGPTLATRAGPHVVVVGWSGAPVWASWLETPAGSSRVRVDAAVPPPCSRDDVGRARLEGEAVTAAGTRCASWVAAVPAGEGIRASLCAGGRCGPLLDWSAPLPWTWNPPPVPREKAWPSWASWTLGGVGAVVAGGIVVLASGALRSAPTETRFVGGGVRAQ